MITPVIEDKWHHRLANWALWKAGVDTVTRAIEEKYRKVRQGSWRIDTSEPPRLPQPLVGEAMDTDRLVRRLSDEHQEAITVVYVWTYPETLEARAASLTPPVHRNTLTNRLNAGKQELERMDADRHRATVRRLAIVRAFDY
jgi:hypothetical protein